MKIFVTGASGYIGKVVLAYSCDKMPRQTAPTKSTGGGGFTFAGKLAAGFLVQVLRRTFPVAPDFGPISAPPGAGCSR
jgi:uncharacterized protein YbjT (DUF2867 family)